MDCPSMPLHAPLLARAKLYKEKLGVACWTLESLDPSR